MGKGSSTKSSRKLHKKMRRAAERGGAADGSDIPQHDTAAHTGAATMDAVLASSAGGDSTGLPQTRRERLLRRALRVSRKSSALEKAASTTVGKKRTLPKVRAAAAGGTGVRRSGLRVGDEGGEAGTSGRVEDDGEGEASIAMGADREHQSRGSSRAAQLKRSLAHAAGTGKPSFGTSATSAVGPRIVYRTSMNLSSARRHDMFVSEINHFNSVLAHQDFQADPLGAIQKHLEATAHQLQPQTEDVGRAASYQRRGEVLKQARSTAARPGAHRRR